jgi:hypothetical protein
MCHTPGVVLGLVVVHLGSWLVAVFIPPPGVKPTVPHDTAAKIGLRKTAEKPRIS